MDVFLLCLYVVLSCVGRGLSEELIPLPKESYPVCNEIQKTRKGIDKVDRSSNQTSYLCVYIAYNL
jgi:hypothetical protein